MRWTLLLSLSEQLALCCPCSIVGVEESGGTEDRDSDVTPPNPHQAKSSNRLAYSLILQQLWDHFGQDKRRVYQFTNTRYHN